MINKTAMVKSKKIETPVEVDFIEYETVLEAQEDIGDEVLLETLNAMVKTRAMNSKRSELTGGGKVTKTQLAAVFMVATPEDLGTLQAAMVARENAAEGSEEYDVADSALRDVINGITG